jgi:transglutaminase-like putative cysteine protease
VPVHYAIRHVTRFGYDTPVSETLMEVRMQPRTEGSQRCLRFELGVTPRARVLAYRDHLGNSVHHFDTPARHTQLTITARACVQLDPPTTVPATLDLGAWEEIDQWARRGEYWDFTQPSRFAQWTPALCEYAATFENGGARRSDPLTTVRTVMDAIHRDLEYVPKSTKVDSPIDVALLARRGVCQDFAHITIGVVRLLGLPCRYVSGYIAPLPDDERSLLEASATHAWVEVMLPALGWIGVDPTHGAEAGLRHVRVAVGRDYSDVPPTRGVFKGGAGSALTVSVEITPTEAIPSLEPMLPDPQWASDDLAPALDAELERQAQMQQQQ